MRRSSLPILETISIASPCSADWDSMEGDERRRFCGACEKHVYDLEVLDADELVELIEATEGKFCGRLFKRVDGRVLTADCPIGMSDRLAALRKKRRMMGAAGAVAAIALAAGGYVLAAAYGGCSISGPERPLAGEIEMVQPVRQPEVEPPKPDVVVVPQQPMMGGVAIPQEHKLMGKIAVRRPEQPKQPKRATKLEATGE